MTEKYNLHYYFTSSQTPATTNWQLTNIYRKNIEIISCSFTATIFHVPFPIFYIKHISQCQQYYYSLSLQIVKIKSSFYFPQNNLVFWSCPGFCLVVFFSVSEVNFTKFQVHALLHLDELSLIKQIEINFHWK